MAAVDGLALFEIVVRSAGVGILLFAALIFVRESGDLLAGRLTALFAFGVGGYLICSSPTLSAAFGAAKPIVSAICGGAAVFLWWATLALFIDGFRLRPVHLVPLIVVEVTVLFGLYGPESMTGLRNLAFPIHDATSIAVIVHALLVAWHGREADLVERRRSFRMLFVPITGLYGLLVLAVQLVTAKEILPAWLPALNATVILFLASWLLSRSLKLTEDSLVRVQAPDEAEQPTRAAADSVSPEDQVVLTRLQDAMAKDKIYRQAGLSIGKLAEKLSTNEHRLRRVINKGLGYRNFNAFLNKYRLTDAKAQLADPDYAHLPVLTIAMDLGFGSIGPFNRAFRDATGLTPTEYRRRNLSGDGPRD